MPLNDSSNRSSGFVKGVVSAFFAVSSVLGAAAIVVGFLLLFYNESRVNPVLKSGLALPLDAYASAPWGADGQFVAVSGVPDEREMVGDGMLLEPGPYLEVRREIEVYSWYETRETREGINPDDLDPRGFMPGNLMGGRPDMGGPQTIYRYELRWTSNPHDSLGFNQPEGHKNPPIHIEKGTFRPDVITIGNYSVSTKNLVMPLGEDLRLSEDITDMWDDRYKQDHGVLVGDYVYIDEADPNQPKVGDVRVRYKVVPAGERVTIYGVLRGDRIEPYDDKATGAYRLEAGGIDPSAFEASRRFRASQWVTRALSFLVILAGMLLVVMAPLVRRCSSGAILLSMIVAALVASVFGVAMRMYQGLEMVVVGALVTWFIALLLGRSLMKSS